MSSGRTEGAVFAVIDVAIDAIRMLVARVGADGLSVQARRTAPGVAPHDVIATEHTVATMTEEARRMGAEKLTVACAAAMCDVGGGGRLIEAVGRASGRAPRIVDDADEIELVFRGLAAGAARGPLLACDLDEYRFDLMSGADGRLEWAASVPAGTRQILRRLRLADPPPLDAMDAMVALAAVAIERHVAAAPHVAEAKATGRGALAVGAIAGTHLLHRDALFAALGRMVATPAAQLAQEVRLRRDDVRLASAGVAVLEAFRRSFRLDVVVVSEAGRPEGLLMEMAQSRTHPRAGR